MDEIEAREALKASLLVLCAVGKVRDWHPNMTKDIAFAIEAARNVLGIGSNAFWCHERSHGRQRCSQQCELCLKEDLCCDGCHQCGRAVIPVLFGVVVRGADMREEIVNPDDPRAANGTPVYTFAHGAKENSNV